MSHISAGGGGVEASGYVRKTYDREADTVYQNTTGGPLEVSATVSPESTGTTNTGVVIRVDGDTLVSERLYMDSGTLDNTTHKAARAIVSDGGTYEIILNPGGTEIDEVYEQELS